MKRILLSLCLITLALDSNGGQTIETGQQAEIAKAKVAIKEFAGALQTELKTAMQAGGPVAAIAVCNARAMPITEKIAAEKGMQLSRVSLKNRNPVNAPNDWQTLADLYPQDRATGFSEGDIRGAFVVTRKISD